MHNGVVDAAFHIAYRLANSVVTMLVLQILILERSDMDWSLAVLMHEMAGEGWRM
jgi:hypothetical protein